MRKTIILAAAIIAGITAAAYLLYQPYTPNWDEHVYYHEAHYLDTGGEQGLIETLRPLGLPVLLTTVTPASMEATRLLTTIIGGIMLLLFYYALRSLRVGTLEAVLITTVTGIIPLVFEAIIGIRSMPLAFAAAMLSVLAYGREHWAWYAAAGITAAYATMTRAVYGAWLITGALIPLIYAYEDQVRHRRYLKRYLGYIGGAGATLAGFATLHYQLYADTAVENGLHWSVSLIYPLYQQLIDHTSNYVWLNAHGGAFYISVLYGITPLILAAPLIMERITDSLTTRQAYVGSTTIIIGAFLFLTPHKEPRYLLAILPFLTAGAYLGLTRIIQHGFAPTRRIAAATTAILFAATMLPSTATHLGDELVWHEVEAEHQSKLKPLPFNGSDDVLLSTPVVDGPGDYHVGYYSHDTFHDKLTTKKWDGVVYDSKAFPCRPADADCIEAKIRTEDYLNQTYTKVNNASTTSIWR